ncbi:MAG: CGNR zinc finger domain-containing protein [Gemmatimonadota bacterium]
MTVTFDMIGGRTCLDFVNTGSQRRVGPFNEELNSYEDLLAWGSQADQLTLAEASHLNARGAQDAQGAKEVLERARALREAIYRVFTARAAGAVLPAADLKLISEEHARAAVNRVLTPTGVGTCSFQWQTFDALDRPLWPVAVSAVNLAASEDATRVKECGTENCNWLFLDTSKNRSRRWCDMKECGNREKARRHYHRRRSTS